VRRCLVPAKRDVDFFSSANDELHRLNRVNFSHLCVVVLACQPNNVNGVSVPGSPCVTQSMFPILFQCGITINRLCVGMAFGILINAILVLLCNVLHCKKNTNVKCMCKINTHKIAYGTLATCYFNFWA
jgi:hypothetical protein